VRFMRSRTMLMTVATIAVVAMVGSLLIGLLA